MDTNNRFTLFQALPTELRFKIWEHALSDHVIVDFIPKPHQREFHVAVGELHPVRTPLSIDHSCIGRVCKEASYIGRACKEAWHVMKGPCQRIEFAAGNADSPHYYTDWLDFSNTTFFLGHGGFGSYCVNALMPEHISAHVKSVATPWSTYADMVATFARLTMFPALQRLVLLVPEDDAQPSPLPFHDTITVLDFYLQGRIRRVEEDPHHVATYTRNEVQQHIQKKFAELGLREFPTVEVVLVSDSPTFEVSHLSLVCV